MAKFKVREKASLSRHLFWIVFQVNNSAGLSVKFNEPITNGCSLVVSVRVL